MSLKNEVALDTRLVVGDAVQVVVEGASQNLPRNISATQVNNSTISWNNILSIGANVLIDSAWFIEYDVEIVYDVRTVAGAGGVLATLPGLNQAGTALVPMYSPANCPNVAFSQYPLNRVCNSISLQFNNVETTINESQFQNNAREFLVDVNRRNDLVSSCPDSLYNSPNTVLQTAAAYYAEQANSPYWNCGGRSRASFSPKSFTTVAANIAKAVYTIREPIFISPLSLHNGPALANIQSINLRLNLDSSNGLQGMLQFPTQAGVAPPTVAQLSCNIKSAELYLDYLTVDISKTGPLPSIAYYNFDFPEFNQTQFTKLQNAIGVSTQYSGVSTNSYKLTTMPKYYYCKITPQVQGLSACNNMCGLPIQQITIQFGSFGLYTFQREQLWQCFRRNTCNLDLSFNEWVALGTPIVLNPALDITSANDIFTGKTGDSGIMFQNSITCTNENYANSGLTNYGDIGCDPTTTNWYIYEVFVNVGSCQIGQGSCVFKNSTMSEAEFVANSGDLVSEDAVKASQGVEGGSFMGTLKNVLHGARHVVGTGARMLSTPMGQAGLKALSGGDIVRRRGRKM